jgi:serine/threonine protein kinase
MTLSSGTLLNNRYRIVAILGQGGMGAVYRAVDEHLGVSVAVKENLFLTDEYSRQFQREASILAGLRQPSLPHVRDYFTVPNQGQYLVMDFIEGEDLRGRIERLRVLPEKDVVIIGILINDALTYLHSRKAPIVHRDIKPGNIKISPEGEAFLVDFGLAKIMTSSQATSTGARAMTPGFSPPEQYGTGHTDARTDIYSLGATLYAALTGMIPEDGLARATGKEELTSVRDLEPKVNRKLASVIEKALELDPENRYQTAADFKSALLEASELDPASVNRITIPPPPPRPPEFGEGEEASDQPDDFEAEAATPARSRSTSAKRRAARRRLRTGAIAATIVVVLLALLLIAVPGFYGKALGMLGYAPPTPTATRQLTLLPTADNPPTPVDPTSTLPPALPSATIPPTQAPTRAPTATTNASSLPQIAFASNRSGSMQIWLMDAMGNGLVQLTSLAGGGCQPAWSPDGTKIAFVSPCKGKDNYAGGRIFIMNADGNDLHPLPIAINPEGDYEPAWSPDGKKIAYTSLNSEQTQIYIYDFSTSTTRNISNSKSPDSNPAWSPDGTQVAFARKTVNSLIWLMTKNGGVQEPFNLSDPSTASFMPAWTPDGKLILYSQSKGTNGVPTLQALRLSDKGTNREFRIPAGGQDIGPVAGVNISTDGLWIVYESWPDGKNHDIYRVTINGTDLTLLTRDQAFDFGPAWRP